MATDQIPTQEAVQCPHCSYWDHPGEHTWPSCASNLRTINRELAKSRNEHKVRADVAEETLADVRRIVADG